MRTDKQTKASKANGGKSKGPVTPEGKANSSKNAVRHNLCTGHLVVLSTEDPREFQRHENHFFDRFQPLDGVERDLVHKMVAASWREKRIASMESAVIELEMDRQRSEVEEEFDFVSPQAREALALFGTSDTVIAATLLLRYGSAVRRSYASAYRILKDMQGDRFNRTPVAVSPDLESKPRVAGDNNHNNTSTPPPELSTSTGHLEEEAIATAPGPIVIVRRRPEPHTSPVHNVETAKLPNEPKTACAASASAGSMGATATAKAAAASAQTLQTSDREQQQGESQYKAVAA
jgi:hypothetical protein